MKVKVTNHLEVGRMRMRTVNHHREKSGCKKKKEADEQFHLA